MENDRTELNDLAGKYPDIVKEMASMYNLWEKFHLILTSIINIYGK